MHQRVFYILLSCCTLFILSCKKQSTDPPTPTDLDFSAVDKVLADSVPVDFDGKCYVVIHKDGKAIYQNSIGGYDGNTKQFIASCSKWLSGAVLMSLVDEGKIKLSDTLGKFLPIFSTYAKGNITIAQLFSHTSGFPGNSDQGYENNFYITLEQSVNLIAQNVPLINTPGAKFYYGGVSMQIAGRLCEVVSGKTWGVLAKEKIFDPCGMVNTDYGFSPNPIIAGGARSTANDYIKFLDMILNKGVTENGTRVLSESSVDAMQQNQIGNATVAYSPAPPTISLTNFYGIGNWRDYLGANDQLIENSSPGAFGSHPWINHEKNYTGIIFTFIISDGYTSTLPTCIKIRELVSDIIK